jgi:hypothetical protein
MYSPSKQLALWRPAQYSGHRVAKRALRLLGFLDLIIS